MAKAKKHSIPKKRPANPKSSTRARKNCRAFLPSRYKNTKPLGHFTNPTDDPSVYGLIVRGDCFAPTILDGDSMVVSPTTPITPGMLVVFYSHHHPEPMLKRLESQLPDVPFRMHPESDVEPMVSVSMDNPRNRLMFRASILEAAHACVGFMRAGTFHPLKAPSRTNGMARKEAES